MIYIVRILLVVAAYLTGSVPTAVWVGKFFYHVDVREHGSKNAGATNTFRVLGLKAGLIVFAIDLLKGFLATQFVYASSFLPHTNEWVLFQIILGAAAVAGHIFPLYAGFKGGKGVATLLGISLAIHPWATLCSFLVFVTVVWLTRYISLGSITGSFAYPFFLIFLFHVKTPALIIYACIIFLLLVVTHRKNIKRLIRGEESKFYFRRKLMEAQNKKMSETSRP